MRVYVHVCLRASVRVYVCMEVCVCVLCPRASVCVCRCWWCACVLMMVYVCACILAEGFTATTVNGQLYKRRDSIYIHMELRFFLSPREVLQQMPVCLWVMQHKQPASHPPLHDTPNTKPSSQKSVRSRSRSSLTFT